MFSSEEFIENDSTESDTASSKSIEDAESPSLSNLEDMEEHVNFEESIFAIEDELAIELEQRDNLKATTR